MKDKVKECATLTSGTMLIVVGIYFFMFPNNFSTGGVSGISVIISHYVPNISTANIMLMLNVLLLAAGFLVLGKDFGWKTVYVSLLMSGMTSLLELLVPLTAPLSESPVVDLFFAVGLSAVGASILFNQNASGGGTDIIAMILHKYISLDIGKALMCTDIAITFLSCVAFGINTGLLNILGVIMQSLFVDIVIESIHTHKYFHVITSNPESIEKYITTELKRSATRLQGQGVYTHQGRTVLLTVMDRRQAILLRRYVQKTDPTAFVLIMNTGEIIGKGFRGVS